jgi:hypothetical protein
MNAPVVGTNQSWAKPWALGGKTSGCMICHTSKDADYFYKSDMRGRMYQELNGPAVINGIPTDAAVDFFNKNH